jgi:predicted nucleic acid-binding protein
VRRGEVEAMIAAHSVAEVYAVLSTLPVNPRITPSAAWALVEHSILPFAKAIHLTASETALAVQRVSRQGLAGGVVCDALIAEAARKGGVECIVTLNTADFQGVSAGDSLEIREP